MRSDNLAVGVLGAAVVVGLGVAAVTYGRQRSTSGEVERGDKRGALVAYLREHLTGSDAAIQVVERLRLAHAGTQEGRLFASLFDEFREEREIVRVLLAQAGASPLSIKRLAGQAGGAVMTLAAGGERGDLSLFRTLEGLSVGVQGKRCLWRALQSLLGDQPIPSARSLAGLETMAVRQWDAIEERRRALVAATFATLELSPADVPID
ncbi:MAG: hypothetical protein ABIT71_13760 [Vicinamibacteraceae bacterium]